MTRKYHSPFLKIGTLVQSRYRGRWYGVVEALYPHYDKDNHIVICRITHSQNLIPMRKPFFSLPLSTYWLRVVDKIPQVKHG